MENKKNIWQNCYKMHLGDKEEFYPDSQSSEILIRVPEGWIYIYSNMQGTTSTFVPRN